MCNLNRDWKCVSKIRYLTFCMELHMWLICQYNNQGVSHCTTKSHKNQASFVSAFCDTNFCIYLKNSRCTFTACTSYKWCQLLTRHSSFHICKLFYRLKTVSLCLPSSSSWKCKPFAKLLFMRLIVSAVQWMNEIVCSTVKK